MIPDYRCFYKENFGKGVFDMNKRLLLDNIRRNYEEDNINVIQYLHQLSNESENDIEDIMISYDFQAGSYTEDYKGNEKARNEYLSRAVSVIDGLEGKKESFLECGVGEATIIVPLLKLLKTNFKFCAGIDISWSRIKYAQKFTAESGNGGVELAVGDMFNLPF